MERYQTIRCPYCDAEYLPGEIFLPNYFLGKPTEVVRDFSGKLLYYDGVDQDFKEAYTCDYCNNTFDVVAKITYKVDERITHSNSYVQKL